MRIVYKNTCPLYFPGWKAEVAAGVRRYLSSAVRQKPGMKHTLAVFYLVSINKIKA
jgi:hypothetical protein